MNVILIAVIILGVVGLVASIMLYAASKKFAVVEDERIGQVAEVLPQANCGGCGYPGCAGFAAACVKAADGGSLEGKLCPVGGQPVMEKVAGILGLAAAASTPKVAVVRCNGTCANRPRVVDYDGVRSCRVQLLAGTGETACAFGCLGGGDCVAACQFGALSINPETGLPEVDEERCTACGACVKTCRESHRAPAERTEKPPMVVMCVKPRQGCCGEQGLQGFLYRLRQVREDLSVRGHHSQQQFGLYRPGKVQVVRKCEEACPKGAIHALNFPPRKPKVEKPAATAAPKPTDPAAQPVSAPQHSL